MRQGRCSDGFSSTAGLPSALLGSLMAGLLHETCRVSLERNRRQALQFLGDWINYDADGFQGSHAQQRLGVFGAEYHSTARNFAHEFDLGEAKVIFDCRAVRQLVGHSPTPADAGPL